MSPSFKAVAVPLNPPQPAQPVILPPLAADERVFMLVGSPFQENQKLCNKSDIDEVALKKEVEKFLQKNPEQQMEIFVEIAMNWPKKWTKMRELIAKMQRREKKIAGQKRSYQEMIQQRDAAAAANPAPGPVEVD